MQTALRLEAMVLHDQRWEERPDVQINRQSLATTEAPFMSLTIASVVKDGVAVPSAPLPEGALVEIRLNDNVPDVPPEWHAELAAWQLAGAKALALVERLAPASEVRAMEIAR